MVFKKGSRHTLIDPFPLENLVDLEFGDADGIRDDSVEKAFVETSSIRLLQKGRHTVISGPIGSGKSAAFKLLKSRSVVFENYIENVIVVPVEEAISFHTMHQFIDEYFPKEDKHVIYQIVWLLHIAVRIAETLSNLDGFPQNSEEKFINKFLEQTNSREQSIGLLDKAANIFKGFSAKIEAKIANTPIALQVKMDKTKTDKRKKVNLNKVLEYCSKAVAARENFDKVLIIIDKIDKFVAGIEYDVQKKYIEALLEIEDDLVSIQNFHFNIFIRSDLFARLSFSSLGYDKVNDRTLKLEWTDDEILQFVANRILVALENSKIATLQDMIESTDLSQVKMSGIGNSFFFQFMPAALKRFIFERREITTNKRTSLIPALSKSIITKVFPRKISHYNNFGELEEILTCEFIKTHFRDGRGLTTPRYLLIFLKEVQNKIASYYDDNPQLKVNVTQFGGDYEWALFERNSVYQAYLDAKTLYMKNLCNIDDRWTKWIVQFLAVKGTKSEYSFKWIRSNVVSSNDIETTAFVAFLQSVGFLRVKKHNPEFKKRTYTLPIMYLPHPSPKPILVN